MLTTTDLDHIFRYELLIMSLPPHPLENYLQLYDLDLNNCDLDLDLQAVGSMDEEFYQQLMRRHGQGEIDDDELERLVEEHLERVDEFKHKVHRKMQQMRRKKAARARQVWYLHRYCRVYTNERLLYYT